MLSTRESKNRGFAMEAAPHISVLFATAAQNWMWLLAALIIGLIVGWMSYRAGPNRGAAGR